MQRPKRELECGELLHGHPCPPLALGLRAGHAALGALETPRAVERELFAMVEVGGDHYGQGFADGVQVATGCTFGKDLIVRVPHGKLGLTLVDQRRRRAVRVAVRGEVDEALESSEWFRVCEARGQPWAPVPDEVLEPLLGFVRATAEDRLFSVSPVFPMELEDGTPSFRTVPCDACGDRVLLPYVRERGEARLCLRCAERRALPPR
ncbi:MULTISPECIES: FmdE family protein [Anaeromyxobacter]|uniref:FmdE family protein n=1 Tax=Anaeromyxobacter TaxID=161492 RepID=UPI001F5A9CE9|nr:MULTISPECIES: FmdE family protein [unclassified Anaeromyxobacter]